MRGKGKGLRNWVSQNAGVLRVGSGVGACIGLVGVVVGALTIGYEEHVALGSVALGFEILCGLILTGCLLFAEPAKDEIWG